MAKTSAYQRVVNAKKPTQPISVKYIHKREWYGVAVGITVEPDHWDKENGLVKDTHTDHVSLNSSISSVATELMLVAAELQRQGIEPTVPAVRDAHKLWRERGVPTAPLPELPRSSPSSNSFLLHLDQFIQSKNGGYTYGQIKARNRKLRAEDRTKKIEPTNGIYGANTMKTFYNLYRLMEEFQVQERRTLLLEDFDKNLLMRFQGFLVGHKNYLNSSVCKMIKSVKRVLNHLADDDLMPHAKYKRFVLSDKKKTTAKTVIALTKAELEELWALELDATPGVAYVRDLFVLGCSSGLRYSDLIRLSPSHVRKHHIHIETQKTGEAIAVPLNSLSSGVLIKHQYSIRKISNKTYNEHLKTLLRMLPSMLSPIEHVRWSGAERRSEVVQRWTMVTTHTARRTFINIALESGVSVAVLRSWVGHSNLEQLLQYADQNRNAVAEMGKAFGMG